MFFKDAHLNRCAALVLGAATLIISAVRPAAADPLTISSQFFFREDAGPNTIGLPTGDLMQLGANITPSGPPTTAQANQGSTVLGLTFTPQPIFPNDYETVFPFNPGLTGAWAISATRGPDSAGPVLTTPIPGAQFLPLVNNLRVEGTGLTPTLMWEWPDTTGVQVDTINFRIIDAISRNQLTTFHNIPIPVGSPGTTAAFQVPDGLLQFDQSYIFRVNLLGLSPDGSTMDRSSTFTQTPYSPVPEPGCLTLMGTGLGLLGFTLCHQRD